jgi:hypothetical protein
MVLLNFAKFETFARFISQKTNGHGDYAMPVSLPEII